MKLKHFKATKVKKEHILGVIIALLGIVMFIDGVSSLMSIMNNHNLILDLGRILRIVSGVALIFSGTYIFWVNE